VPQMFLRICKMGGMIDESRWHGQDLIYFKGGGGRGDARDLLQDR
jgi:hypothetical protein